MVEDLLGQVNDGMIAHRMNPRRGTEDNLHHGTKGVSSSGSGVKSGVKQNLNMGLALVTGQWFITRDPSMTESRKTSGTEPQLRRKRR